MSNLLPPVDPNVSVPPAVKALAARADAAFRAVNGIPDSTLEVVLPPENPPAEPAPEVSPQPPVVEPPVVTSEVKTPPEVNWEHKYKSMEGRHNRSQEQIRAMGEQIKQLQGLLATPPSQPDISSRETAPSLITEQEETEYGKEFLDVVGKRAKQELSSEVEELRKTIKDLKSRVETSTQVATQDARARLENTLTTQVPNWLDINVSQEFHDWLALPDAYSGVIRHELLKSAYERNDTPRTLAFFKGFLSEEAALAPAETGLKPGQNTVDLTTGKIPLETFAAPGRAKTAATGQVPTEKPSFTRLQVSQFYQDVARGKYRGDDAKKNAIEAQIIAAGNEGRLR